MGAANTLPRRGSVVGGKLWRKAVGANLRAARLMWGGSARKAASLLGLWHGTIYALERGLSGPTLETFVRLCGLYCCRVEDVLNVEE